MSTDAEVIADKLIVLMNRGQIYRNRYVKSCPFSMLKNELSERQFNILIALDFLKINTVSELSSYMDISKSTLSIILSKMIKKGYITKVYPEEQDDKRKVYFYISDVGKNILDSARKTHFNDFKMMYEKFTEEERIYLKEGIMLLSQTADSYEQFSEYAAAQDSELSDIEIMGKRLDSFFKSFIEYNQRIFKGAFNINGNSSGLTKNQFNILTAIRNLNHDTITKLENFLNSSGSTVSITISKLVSDGYLYKEQPADNEDKRVVYIRLTDKGVKTLDDMKNTVRNLLIEYVENLTIEKRKTLNLAVDKFLLVFKL